MTTPVDIISLERWRPPKWRVWVSLPFKAALVVALMGISGLASSRLCGVSVFQAAILSPFGFRPIPLPPPILSGEASLPAKAAQAAQVFLSSYILLLLATGPPGVGLLLTNRARFRLTAAGAPYLLGALALWHLGLICLLSGIDAFFSWTLKGLLLGSLAGGFGLKILPAGSEAFASAKRRMLQTADALLRPNRSAPILYLRPFAEDEQVPDEELGRNYDTGKGFDVTFYTSQRQLTFEEILCDGLGAVAPVLALERPGASSLPLGATRRKVHEETWQEEIRQLLKGSRFAAVVVGSTPSLLWELRIITATQPFSKLLLVLPSDGVSDKWTSFVRSSAEIACFDSLPERLPASALAVAFRPGWRAVVLTGPKSVAGFRRVAEWMYDAGDSTKSAE